MSQAVFHLGVTKADLQGASLAIIPGDPARVQKIAEAMTNPIFLASQREYTLYLSLIHISEPTRPHD